LCTGKPVFICFCFPWTYEYVLLRDGTTVRVLGLESSPGEQTVYRVQVIRSSTHVDDGLLGTIRGCWLVVDNNATIKSIPSIDSPRNKAATTRRAQPSQPLSAAPFLAAVSRSAVTAITDPSASANVEADLRDRISQILSKTGSSDNSTGDTPSATTSTISLSTMSTASLSTSTLLSTSSSSTSSSTISTGRSLIGRAGRPGLPSDASTSRISPAKPDSKRPATTASDERVQIVLHQAGGSIPTLPAGHASYDIDHSYKTPPLSPVRTPATTASATAVPSIPLLPPPVGDDVAITLSHHSTTMVSTTTSTSTSGAPSAAATTSSSHKVDHPLHPRYTAAPTPSSTPSTASTTTTTTTTTTQSTVIANITTPSATHISTTTRHHREEEKYPVGHSTRTAAAAAATTSSTDAALSPTSAILAAIGSPPPSLPSSKLQHHRPTPSSDMSTVTLAVVDVNAPISAESALSPTTASIMSRVGANGASFANFRLPEGEIQAADIEAIVALVAAGARDITYPLIFARLAGCKRVLSGDVLRPFLHELLNKANVQATPSVAAREAGAVGDVPREAMDVLWKLSSQLIDIRTGVDFLELNFNFGAGVKESTIKVPGTYTWVLDSKFKEDPLAVHPLNKPKYHCSDTRTLVIRNQVRFKMNAAGIESVRDGDLAVKQIFKFNAGLRTEHKANTIEYDSLDRPFIEVRDGKPVIVDGHYVARRLNDWLVVNVLKKDVYIGLPDLATA